MEKMEKMAKIDEFRFVFYSFENNFIPNAPQKWEKIGKNVAPFGAKGAKGAKKSS